MFPERLFKDILETVNLGLTNSRSTLNFCGGGCSGYKKALMDLVVSKSFKGFGGCIKSYNGFGS